jgi:hypothetical protein
VNFLAKRRKTFRPPPPAAKRCKEMVKNGRTKKPSISQSMEQTIILKIKSIK